MVSVRFLTPHALFKLCLVPLFVVFFYQLGNMEKPLHNFRIKHSGQAEVCEERGQLVRASFKRAFRAVCEREAAWEFDVVEALEVGCAFLELWCNVRGEKLRWVRLARKWKGVQKPTSQAGLSAPMLRANPATPLPRCKRRKSRGIGPQTKYPCTQLQRPRRFWQHQ